MHLPRHGTLVLWAILGAALACANPSEPPPAEVAYDLIFSGLPPDGAGSPQLFRVALDGSAPALLAGGVLGYQPSAKADGSAIAYHRVDLETGQHELMLLAAGMSSPVPFSGATGVLDREVAWSPGGTRLLFISHRDDDFGDLFVANVSGAQLAGVTNLTPSLGPDVTGAWSPDGTRIAFTSYRTDHPSIWTMNADGSGLNQITSGTNDYGDYFPSWSPDGATLAFQRIGAESSRIGTVPSAGGTPSLFAVPGRNYSPRWSPDGARIAIASEDGDIRVIDVAGNVVLRIERPGADRSPSWIPQDSPIR